MTTHSGGTQKDPNIKTIVTNRSRSSSDIQMADAFKEEGNVEYRKKNFGNALKMY